MKIERAFSVVRIGIFCIFVLYEGLTAARDSAGDGDNNGSFYKAAEIFEPVGLHVHGASIVELPNGDLMAAWFEGSGERWADDIQIKGARFRSQEGLWSETFKEVRLKIFRTLSTVT